MNYYNCLLIWLRMASTACPSIVVLTGAGISAESGVRTFRASDGLWEDHRIEDVATPEGFVADPALVQRFYNERRASLRTVEPNAAHIALAQFSQAWPGKFLLVTQNIDNLHERGGSTQVVHMHGELNRAQCTDCDYVGDAPAHLEPTTSCPTCPRGRLRPHVVWFGEQPLQLDLIHTALLNCGIFIAVGTSGQVYPAAGFVELARSSGARCIEVNLADTITSTSFSEQRIGPATEQLSPLFDELLAQAA